MRWYKISVGGTTWDATNNPNAQDIELDIPVGPMHVPGGNAFARVWGIPLQQLLTANTFNNQTIQVYGGMQQGLPLANPNQQGLLAQGSVFPCVGNWVGTDMTLDFFFPIPVGSSSTPRAANVIHNWQSGTPLSQAMQQTLSAAFPKFTPKINISPNLILNYTDSGFYQSLPQYAQYILNISRNIITSSTYQGVYITVQGTTINVQDGTMPQTAAGTINFQDLIGQPIWTGPNSAQWKTVMRADFNIGDNATLPQSLATLTGTSGSQIPGSSSQSNTIQGSFKIVKIRHTGKFRQPDWPSWCTTFDGVQSTSSTGGAGGNATGAVNPSH